MKKVRSIVAFLTLATVLLVSCKRYYEEVPVEQVTFEYIWDTQDSSATNALLFLNSVYNYIPNGYNRLPPSIFGDLLCTASDDAIPSRFNTDAGILATGGMTIFFGPEKDNVWAKNYQGIRQATDFLNKFGVVPYNDPVTKKYFFGEARASRAMFYWELVHRWGGVPLLGDTILNLEDNAELPRNTFEECIEYIVNECDKAADSVRTEADEANVGRWTKGAVLALKARVLLYAASPRHNGGNIGDELTGYTSYDVNRWKRAADAAKVVMDLNMYQLDPDFRNIFLVNNSVETIFSHANEVNHSIEDRNGPPNYATAFATGWTSPTQELVDAYGMKNGLPITDPASGYNPDSPYNNRDPRFYYTILYNGALWLGTPLQTYEGGFAKPGGTQVQTRTGYYMRKFFGKFENATQYANHFSDFIIFRYAEILLNFAEAQNEFLGGPDADVYGAVDSIRSRAGLEPYLLAPGLSKDSMRSIIINERRKEFAFEEQRYWDIRRWKIAGDVYNAPLHGMSIIKSAAGDLIYNRVEVLDPVFEEPKMYFYPIPYNEIVSNKNMVQNPGW